MRQATNVPDTATLNMRAPINQFAQVRAYPKADEKDVVRYNSILSTRSPGSIFLVNRSSFRSRTPKAAYSLLPMLDMWTDVYTVPGKRTTGTGAQTFAIVGPDWHGSLPTGIERYNSPTGSGLLIGRTQTNGKADYEAVRGFQDGMKAVPLSAYGKPYTAPKNTVNPNQDMSAPPDQIDKMDGATFFAMFAELMKENPPHANDYPILERMKRIGIEPGKSLSVASAPKDVQDALNAVPVESLKQIKATGSKSGALANGWRTNLTAIGTYGTDYLHRAGVAFAGLGANVIEDAVYPTALVDADGQPFSSDNRYILHFAKDRILPARAFWSLTMYDERQLFTENPIGRYAIGDRDKLRFNSDGSLDLYIQRRRERVR